MAKVANIPQQVSIASMMAQCAVANSHRRVPIELGDDEIAILLATNWQAAADDMLPSSSWGFLYRKTETEPNWDAIVYGDWASDPNVMDTFFTGWDNTNQAGQITDRQYIVYPFPIVLVRQPSIIFAGTINTYLAVTCYYLRERVGKDELARLMVKDHH